MKMGDASAMPCHVLLEAGSFTMPFGPDDVLVRWNEAHRPKVIPHPGAGTWEITIDPIEGAEDTVFPMMLVACPIDQLPIFLNMPRPQALAMLAALAQATLDEREKKRRMH